MRMHNWYFLCLIVQKCLKCQWLSYKDVLNVNGLIHQINTGYFQVVPIIEKYREISLEKETVLIYFLKEETKRDFHLRGVSTVKRVSLKRNVCLRGLSSLERFCSRLRVFFFYLRESLLKVCSLSSGSTLTRYLPKCRARSCPSVDSFYASGMPNLEKCRS